MARKTLSDDFKQQLDESPFDTLTTQAPSLGRMPTPKPMGAKQAVNGHPVDFSNVDAVDTSRNGSQKQRVTVQISADVIERVKNAVYWTPGMTLASLAERAFADAVDHMEKKKGEEFPKRREELKSGRPIK